jgi:putative nucleotidyltransferase with HDIG domain
MTKATFTLSDGTKVTTESEEEREKREAGGFSIKEFIRHLEDDLRNNRITLPTLPTVAIEALMVINDCDSSSDDLVKVISKDTSLTARLIRYANSPLYSGAYSVTSIKPAITCIGFQKVKNAIYSVSMQEVFRTPHTRIQERMDELWAHSVKVGATAAMQARAHADLDPDVALVAGLVHDIGKIPLLIKACEYEHLVSRDDHLERLLEKLHTGMGKAILKRWEFDPALVAVAAEHEDLGRQPHAGEPDYVDLVQVANILVYAGTEHPLSRVDREQVGSFKRLGIATQVPEDGDVESDLAGVEAILF